jgi:DNA-binding MarR family transcriptional regulator
MLRMSQLAERSLSSRSRLSHAVSRLEERGWVRREPAPKDGRGTVAVLTDAGMEMLAATAPGHVTAVREHLFDRLSPEQVRQLGDICAALLDGLGPNRVAPSC